MVVDHGDLEDLGDRNIRRLGRLEQLRSAVDVVGPHDDIDVSGLLGH